VTRPWDSRAALANPRSVLAIFWCFLTGPGSPPGRGRCWVPAAAGPGWKRRCEALQANTSSAAVAHPCFLSALFWGAFNRPRAPLLGEEVLYLQQQVLGWKRRCEALQANTSSAAVAHPCFLSALFWCLQQGPGPPSGRGSAVPAAAGPGWKRRCEALEAEIRSLKSYQGFMHRSEESLPETFPVHSTILYSKVQYSTGVRLWRPRSGASNPIRGSCTGQKRACLKPSQYTVQYCTVKYSTVQV